MIPKVSVIIPAYNAEKTLRRCLDSVFAQDLDAFEVILVNDGSTDGTPEVAREYGKHPNLVLIDQSNKGIARARWAGVEASGGDYVAFVDADDCILENMFSKMHGRAKELDADIAICNWISIGPETIKHDYYTDSTIDNVEKNVNLVIFKYSDGHLCNKMFWKELLSREIFEKTFEVRYFEDIFFSVFAIPQAKRIAYLSDHLYCRFIHPASITQSLSKKALIDLLTVHERIYLHFRQQSNKFYVRKAPGLYVKGLLDITLALRRQGILDDDLEKMGNEVSKKISGIPLIDLLRSGPEIKTLLLLFLLKLNIYDLVRDIWRNPCFRPFRNLGNRFLRHTSIEKRSSSQKK